MGMPVSQGYLSCRLFIRSQLSVLVKFSFSYNTLFLSGLGFMVAQYTLSGV